MKNNFLKLCETLINELTEPTQEMIDWFDKRTKKHIHAVQNNWRLLTNSKFRYIFDTYDPGYTEHILKHDESKFNEPEYLPYIFITWKYKMEADGKQYEIPKDMKQAVNDATTHHVFTNPHHPVYWDKSKTMEDNVINDKDRDKPTGEIVNATKMPDWAIAEMVCDWKAVSDERNSSLKDWADMNVGKDKRWNFNKEQTKLIYDLIDFFENLK